MAKGFGATAVPDQERLGKKSIVSASAPIQEISRPLAKVDFLVE